MDQHTALTANHDHPRHEGARGLDPGSGVPAMDGDTVDDLLLITIPDAAHRLGLCRSKVYELIAEDKLPTIKIGRARRISMEDLRAFVTQHRAA